MKVILRLHPFGVTLAVIAAVNIVLQAVFMPAGMLNSVPMTVLMYVEVGAIVVGFFIPATLQFATWAGDKLWKLLR